MMVFIRVALELLTVVLLMPVVVSPFPLQQSMGTALSHGTVSAYSKSRGSSVHLYLTVADEIDGGLISPPEEIKQEFTSLRFSLFPSVHRDDDANPSLSPKLREVVRESLVGIDTLGLKVLLGGGVMTTCLVGSEPALFEAIRASFGRASRNSISDLPRQVSMQCTFSAGCLCEEEPREELPPRSAVSAKGREFILDAYILPNRVACQFSVYPLGTPNYMEIIAKVEDHAKQQSNVWKEGHFCSMLEGNGAEVLDVLRSCFALAREESNGKHVVMTATLTGNKREWTEDFFARTCND